MIWSAKCLYPEASLYLDNMAGRFIKALLAESNNFLGVKDTVQCCHVLDQMDRFSGLLKSTHLLLCKRWIVISCTLWPISNLFICLLSYTDVEPHYFILSFIIFDGGEFLGSPTLGILWLCKNLIYTVFKNITVMKHLKSWILITKEGKKPRPIFLNIFFSCAWNYWISLNSHYWCYLLHFNEQTTVLSTATVMRDKSRGVSAIQRSLCTKF